jgi:beta-galactosidase
MLNRIVIVLFCFLSFMATHAQIKFDNILYGVAYYHEYMPSDRLDKDVQMMKDAHISVVRLGESTWSLFEPREGEFQFAWMDRILEICLDGQDTG